MHGRSIEKIVVLQIVWTFSSNALPQSLQKLTVNLGIDVFTRGYKFFVDNVWDVKKINMILSLLRTWRLFSSAVNLATSTETTTA